MKRFRTILLLVLLPGTSLIVEVRAQSLHLYGGAGVSSDFFFRDEEVMETGGVGILPSPVAILGLRFRTSQNFDLMLDGSLGTTRIGLPLPSGASGKHRYEQVSSLVLLGSALNIALEKNRWVLPSVHLGAGFFDFWNLRGEGNHLELSSQTDVNTNRWVLICGAGVEYQFNLFGNSGLQLRALMTPLDLFPEPVPYTVQVNGVPEAMGLQGKLTMLQLSYRIAVPIKKWEYSPRERR